LHDWLERKFGMAQDQPVSAADTGAETGFLGESIVRNDEVVGSTIVCFASLGGLLRSG
jgi:hypothetical protein